MSTIRVMRKNVYHTYEINESSSNDTYVVWERAIEGGSTIHLNISGTNSHFRKSGNDLLIYSVYSDSKIVTTTVKDFYKYYGYNFVKINYEGTLYERSEYNEHNINDLLRTEQKIAGYITDTSSDDTIFGTKGNNNFSIFEGGNDKIYDVEGNDTYQLSVNAENKTTTVIDYKGNDKYALNNYTTANITDNKGNDTYKAVFAAQANIVDKKGNDKYTMTYTNFDITDNSGNDTFNISGVLYTNTSIVDKKGNDKYNFNEVYQNGGTPTTTITDSEGNDKYTMSNASKININDALGKDTYSLNYADEITIKDDSGKDTYTVTQGSDISITDTTGKDSYKVSYGIDVYITDGAEGETKSGNDKYSFKHFYGDYLTTGFNLDKMNVIDYYGKEDYSFSYTSSAAVVDYQGSDKYKVKDSLGIHIYDYDNTSTLSSNDKYEATDSSGEIIDDSGNDNYSFATSNFVVTDKLGNDEYKVSGVTVFMTNDDDAARLSITDEAGKDKYNFTNAYAKVEDTKGKDKYTISNSDVIITDNGSDNDTYTVKKLNSKVVIDDKGGTDDKLELSGASKSKLVYMVNYDLSTTDKDSDVKNGSLFIFDRTKSGFVEIKDYLNTSGDSISSGNGDGYIESVKAGLFSINKDINKYTTSESSINALGQAVAQWLSSLENSTAYGSVDAILNSGNADDVAKFITFVQNY